MRSDFWILQTFNGLTYGALLFLLASGLSLIFGVMRVVNMAHGSSWASPWSVSFSGVCVARSSGRF